MKTVVQEYQSAKTSINSKRLPAIYNKLNWLKLLQNAPQYPAVVLDIGAGRHIQHIQDFVEKQGFVYAPYDPFNLPDDVNFHSLAQQPAVIICSNVFNVIKEKQIIFDLHDMIRRDKVPFFITVYEGDRQGVGCSTQKGQSWQRNETLDNYLIRWDEIAYKSVITTQEYKAFIV